MSNGINTIDFNFLSGLTPLPQETIPPYEFIELEIYAPNPNEDILQWDLTRWNRGAWNQSAVVSNLMRWNTDNWNAKKWYAETQTAYTWQSIIGNATQITISRGISKLANSATVGILTVELKGTGSDPRALGITIGTPVKCSLKTTGTRLYTGNLAEITVNPHATKPEETRVILTFADAVATLVNTTRYGARADSGDGSESFTARAHRLAKSAKGITFNITPDNTTIAPTVWETSLANHFDALTATTGGYWTVDRRNNVHVIPTQPSLSAVKISDTHATGGALYYTDISESWNSANLITSIESTTHAAIKTPDGWEAADRTLTVENTTRALTWVGTKASVDLLTPLEGEAQKQATERLLNQVNTTPPIQSNTFIITKAAPLDYENLATLDPSQIITVTRNSENYEIQIKEVTHHITPTMFTTKLTY